MHFALASHRSMLRPHVLCAMLRKARSEGLPHGRPGRWGGAATRCKLLRCRRQPLPHDARHATSTSTSTSRALANIASLHDTCPLSDHDAQAAAPRARVPRSGLVERRPCPTEAPGAQLATLPRRRAAPRGRPRRKIPRLTADRRAASGVAAAPHAAHGGGRA